MPNNNLDEVMARLEGQYHEHPWFIARNAVFRDNVVVPDEARWHVHAGGGGGGGAGRVQEAQPENLQEQIDNLINRPVKGVRENVSNNPELWDKLLFAVKEIYEPDYACVAGGAVRDFKLDKTPKDIDIFVHVPYELEEPYTLMDEGASLGWRNLRIKGNPAKYGHNEDVQFVLTGSVFGFPVEIIFTNKKTGPNIVEGFDFEICQHWYDGEIHSTVMGLYGINKKVWKPVKGVKLDATLREHFNRVNKRHGNVYKLDEGEPWYKKFDTQPKII